MVSVFIGSTKIYPLVIIYSTYLILGFLNSHLHICSSIDFIARIQIPTISVPSTPAFSLRRLEYCLSVFQWFFLVYPQLSSSLTKKVAGQFEAKKYSRILVQPYIDKKGCFIYILFSKSDLTVCIYSIDAFNYFWFTKSIK